MFDVMWRERQGARSTLRQDFDGSYQGLASASIPRCGGSSISSVTARPLKPAHRTISRRSSSITCICTATTTSTRTPRRRCSHYSASGDAKLRTKTLVLVGRTTAMLFIGFPPPNSGRSEDSNDEQRFAPTRSRRRGRPQAARGGEELMKLGSWSSYEMVLRYAHLATDHLRDAAGRIDGTFSSHVRQPQTLRLV